MLSGEFVRKDHSPQFGGHVLLAARAVMPGHDICPVSYTHHFFGRPEHIKTNARLLRSGVDGYFSSTFFYPDKQVILTASKLGQGYCGSQIIGDRGTLTITMLHHLTGIMLHRQDGTLEEICGDIEKPILLANEMKDFSRYINDPLGTRDEYRYAQQLSVAVCETLQEMRAQAGLSF